MLLFWHAHLKVISAIANMVDDAFRKSNSWRQEKERTPLKLFDFIFYYCYYSAI